MSQINRRADVSEQEYLEEQVRSLQLQLAESKGQTRGAIDLGLQISTRASDTDARLVSMGQSRNRLLREHQLMVQAMAELMADISEGRDPVKGASRMVASLALQGVILSGAIQQVINLRAGRDVTDAPLGNEPASPASPSLSRADKPPATPEQAQAEAVAHAEVAASAAASATP